MRDKQWMPSVGEECEYLDLANNSAVVTIVAEHNTKMVFTYKDGIRDIYMAASSGFSPLKSPEDIGGNEHENI